MKFYSSVVRGKFGVWIAKTRVGNESLKVTMHTDKSAARFRIKREMEHLCSAREDFECSKEGSKWFSLLSGRSGSKDAKSLQPAGQ